MFRRERMLSRLFFLIEYKNEDSVAKGLPALNGIFLSHQASGDGLPFGTDTLEFMHVIAVEFCE